MDSGKVDPEKRLLRFMVTFIVLLVFGIFAFDLGHRWWRENEWKRRWRKPPLDD